MLPRSSQPCGRSAITNGSFAGNSAVISVHGCLRSRSLRRQRKVARTPSAEPQAELKLDVGRVAVKPKPEDEVVKVEFSLKNTGTKPVTIVGLESGCACLSASLDKRSYAPGEAGKGQAEFKVGSFVGL